MANKNPQKLDIIIFQGVNALPVLEKVVAISKSREGHSGRKEIHNFNIEDQTVLLARPEIAWLRDQTKKESYVMYKKLMEQGRPYPGNRTGALISVSYEIAR